MGCPFPDKGYRLHTIRIEAPHIKPDSSKVPVIPDTIISRLLLACSGETLEAGSENGVLGKPKIYAFQPDTFTVIGVDCAYNEPKPRYYPILDTVWLTAPETPPDFFHSRLLSDTTKEKVVFQGGRIPFLVWITPKYPEKGERRFHIQVNTALHPEWEYSKFIYWESIPDTIISPESGNFPNPAKREVTIRFEVPPHTEVSLKIYNINGELVREFTGIKNKGPLPIGYIIIWEGRDDKDKMLPSGIYFYKLSDNGVNKIVFLK